MNTVGDDYLQDPSIPTEEMEWEKIQTPATERANITKAMQGATPVTGVFTAEDLISKALTEHHKKIAIAWSGGRCSTVLLYLALKQCPDVFTVFTNTGVQFRETPEFVERIRKEWNVNLHVAKPEITFWEIVKKYGYPHESRLGSPTLGIKGGTPACCKYLKENPATKMYRENKIEALMDGMRVAEARNRMFYMEKYGQFHYVKSVKMWKFHPIAFWSTTYMKEFEAKHNIPINLAYERYRLVRTGCWVCTAFLDWKKSMKKHHPKFLATMEKTMGARMFEHYYKSRIAPCQDRG